MKRQHPTNHNLFWCPKCQTYKARGEFGKNAKLFHGIRGHCKCCCNQMEKNRVKDRDRVNKQKRDWCQRTDHYATHADYYREKAIKNNVKWMLKNPEREKLIKNKNSKRQRDKLADSYIKDKLHRCNKKISRTTIELKRTAITIKRIEREMINELAG